MDEVFYKLADEIALDYKIKHNESINFTIPDIKNNCNNLYINVIKKVDRYYVFIKNRNTDIIAFSFKTIIDDYEHNKDINSSDYFCSIPSFVYDINMNMSLDEYNNAISTIDKHFNNIKLKVNKF